MYLAGKYNWAPKDTTLNEEILPDNYIKGREEMFKPMLQAISKESGLRQRADRLHNMVHTPQTAEYLEQFHHTAQMSNPEMAKDASGTTEMFSDWAEPYERRLNKVRFNGHLHTSMDFGVSETV